MSFFISEISVVYECFSTIKLTFPNHKRNLRVPAKVSTIIYFLPFSPFTSECPASRVFDCRHQDVSP